MYGQAICKQLWRWLQASQELGQLLEDPSVEWPFHSWMNKCSFILEMLSPLGTPCTLILDFRLCSRTITAGLFFSHLIMQK
ncbi:hypothetical protein CDL15_Pgr013736 [Punica granatum]|uniref:Uncharacterized protein n=1 Tax=Punica granatum TaxID=22663 RepID=A0A218W1Y4_PUNGR|nr:hypothetical protein CDL15_Pgr013736 [Punica granatum]